jgi:hypothetical protein
LYMISHICFIKKTWLKVAFIWSLCFVRQNIHSFYGTIAIPLMLIRREWNRDGEGVLTWTRKNKTGVPPGL